jgi:hypothetical protein
MEFMVLLVKEGVDLEISEKKLHLNGLEVGGFIYVDVLDV